MSIYESNSRHLRKVLIFCFNMKKSRLRLIEWSQILMAKPLLVKEHVVSERFNASRTVILTSKTGMAVEEKRFSKMQNWRHYFMKICIKRKKKRRSLIGSDSTCHFKTSESHRNDSKIRKLGAV